MRIERAASIDRRVRRGGHARGVLQAAAHERGETLANLSRLIGRGPGYLAGYVNRQTPAELVADDQQVLAAYLGIDSSLLG